MKKILLGALIAIIFIFTISAIQQGGGASTSKNTNALETSENDGLEKRVKDYNVYSVKLPKKLDFAGEAVPLDQPDIKERVDREFLVNTYWQSNGILLIKRAQKYFPVIEPILKKNGVPDDFKYLAVIESGLQNVTSPAGARGFWQIMPKTGRELGLEVNSNVDERYHLEMATQAACDYLKESKEKFGSWTLAGAAYNAGNGGINKQLEAQGVESYYDLLLGDETGRYVFRILAIKEILKNPKNFGFNVDASHGYDFVPTTKVLVDYEVDDLSAFAKANDINYKILKIHNPWLREPKLNNKTKKEYQIAIPKAGYYD
ncbi:lytic transglycosylase domain-containing protein [Nonlabens dokdonensis]|uniref:Membrane-bound lytic murein transglycosylase n=2 Tax=Nonlabens dokdonensis TaxID=328515 RepID=L7WCU7_NONDD|nr:lytic transglycosylase domain-containing protein [Nonlabens dokdonensis]AGC77751.1 membrane-bound lytic murein transglycosylase [Nonlabens dokdonensis DSW-6]